MVDDTGLAEGAAAAEQPTPQPPSPRCSARGCRESATVALQWRNPSLHDASRRKTWHACADHEAHLADFLGRRGFLLSRDPV
jgi:hypothetical protein